MCVLIKLEKWMFPDVNKGFFFYVTARKFKLLKMVKAPVR